MNFSVRPIFTLAVVAVASLPDESLGQAAFGEYPNSAKYVSENKETTHVLRGKVDSTTAQLLDLASYTSDTMRSNADGSTTFATLCMQFTEEVLTDTPLSMMSNAPDQENRFVTYQAESAQGGGSPNMKESTALLFQWYATGQIDDVLADFSRNNDAHNVTSFDYTWYEDSATQSNDDYYTLQTIVWEMEGQIARSTAESFVASAGNMELYEALQGLVGEQYGGNYNSYVTTSYGYGSIDDLYVDVLSLEDANGNTSQSQLVLRSNTTTVPEPSSLILIAMAGFVGFLRKR